jgi:hypothetical protein
VAEVSRDDDNMGQVDGDAGGRSPFATSMSGRPWITQTGMVPWHMWGNSQTLTTLQTGGGGVASAPDTQQLVRVSYKRPDTWNWCFQSRLLAMPTPGLPGTDALLEVHFDLTIGIGRSSASFPDFEIHRWYFQNPSVPPLVLGAPGNILRSTTARGLRTYEQNSAGVITQAETLIDEIVAQDIQLQARLILTTSGNGFTGSAEVSAFFAPVHHIRPDWFRDGPHEMQYSGDEVEGR